MLSNGDLTACVRQFTFEQGTLAALNATVIAPAGLRLGHLVKDETRGCYATFYAHKQCGASSSLGNFISGVRYSFLGHVLTDVYDGHHLLTLPIAIPNPTVWMVKGLTQFKGPLTHYGYLVQAEAELRGIQAIAEQQRIQLENANRAEEERRRIAEENRRK